MIQVDQLSNQAPGANGSADPLAGLSLDEKRALIAKLLKKDAGGPRMFPLSEAQERLWLVDQWEPGSATYHSCIAVRLEGKLDVDAMQRALNEVVRRHETLRTTFGTVGNKPMQIVAPQANIPLPLRDLGDVPESQREAEAARQADTEVRRPIDLNKGPIFRALLLKLAPDVHDLIVTIHHIVFDGWSAGIFIREACTLYAAFAAGKSSPLPALPTQYGDFTLWQQQWMQSGVLERQLAYWKEALADCQPILELPTDRPRPALLKFNGANRQFRLSADLSRKLRELSQQEGVTLFMTLLAAFQTLLSRYSRQENLLVGCHIAGRGRQEVENLIGVFVNTLAMRGDLSGDPTFRELLRRVRATAVGAFSNPDLPFNKVVEAVHPDRDLSRAPLVQVAFGLRNTPWHAVELADLRLTPRNADTGTSKYDMTLYMSDVEAELFGRLEFNTELFEPATAARFIEQFQVLLESATTDAGQRLSELALMKPAERHKILVEWNHSQTRLHESAASIVTLIEEQVRRTPDHVAVVFEGEQLTYAELNSRANALAHYLRGQGVEPDKVVGICLDRSLEMVVAVLGVLKAGGAYIPLNVEHAPDRLKFILESAGALLVLKDRTIHERQGDLGTPAVCLDAITPQLQQQSVHNPDVAIVGDSLAYILFTSGSTGRPKGVMINHSSLLNAFRAWDEVYHLSEWSPTYLQMANFSFDVWPGDFVRALCSGGKLVLCPPEVLLEAEQLYDLIVREEITATEFVPVVLRHLTNYLERTGRSLNGVRLLVVGADVWYVKDHAKLKSVVGPNTRVFNSYGITEATIDSSIFEGDVADLPPDGVVPIGKPFPNTRMYILDKQLQPVPIGMPGELYIGGPSLARGYVGRDDLTAERFVRNPFFSSDTRYPIPDTRFYKTGDLARWRNDGNVEFLGRADFQVKIRGFRIEPGEIEATLLCHPDVHEAVVIARNDDLGERRLVAYLTRKPQADRASVINVGDIRDFVRGRLPEYMLPSAFVVLESLPLTPSGKMNRAALPVPDWSRPDASETFVAPRSPVEGELARICQDVLRLDRVGIHDNFFALGGDSIRAVQLVASAGRAGLKLTPRQVFQHQTVAGWASVAVPLDAKPELEESKSVEPLVRLSDAERTALNAVIGDDAKLINEVYPLTPAQQGILFHTLAAPGSGVYVIQVSGRLRGLDVAAFRRAWKRLLQRHEPLRTGFVWQDVAQPLQVVYQRAALPWTEFDWSELSEVDLDHRWQQFLQEDRARDFDLAHPPLMRLALAKETGDSYRFVWTHHHLIIDGWSLPLVLREMVTLYEAERTGTAVPPPPKRFRNYIAWLVKQDLAKAEEYWRRTLAGFTAPTPVGMKLTNEAGGPTERRAEVSAGTTSALERLSRQQGLTLNTIVQGAWALLLGRYADQDDVVFGQAVSGRPAELPGVEAMVGMFINTLPVRVKLKPDQPVLGWLRDLHNQQTEQLDYAYSPLMKVQGWTEVPRGTPLFESLVAFENYPIDSAINSEKSGFSAEGVSGRQQVSYPLALQVNPGTTLRLNLMYDRERLDGDAAGRLLGHMQTILEGIAATPDQRLEEIPWLTPAERTCVLDDFNATQVDYPQDVQLHELIERQVERTPAAIAVRFEESEWTYRELNERANRLAHRLRSLGVGTDVRVGVCMERSLELVAALLGVLKAGGAYVPLDPEYPRERLANMLEDAQVPVLLTQRRIVDVLPDHSSRLFCLDEMWPDLATESAANLSPLGSPSSLAYVIFTSGSTGRPKGAMNAHRGIVNRLLWMQDEYKLTADDHVLQKTPFSFDVSVWEFFWPLLTGARLVVAKPGGHRDASYLVETILREKITTLHFVPSMLQAFLEEPDAGRCTAVLHRTICSGEALPLALQNRFFEQLPTCELHNLYGPTEAAVDVTYWQCDPAYERSVVPIGRPVANTQMYVLDTRLQPVPIGVPGELFIGGVQVGLGYLSREELTAEKFIRDPFASETGARLYRTGDRARWLPDGAIEYLGRLDHQVKIRGFRIELGEIEAVLQQHQDVREAAVMAREDRPGHKRLVAYVVPKGTEPNLADLRHFLAAKLPDYMVPTAWVVLSQLPVSPNGKLDRKALPAPEFVSCDIASEFVEPVTEAERALAAIWVDLLKVPRVGTRDNFFALGGDSILAIQVVTRARQSGLTLTPRQLFVHQTVAELATVCSEIESNGAVDGQDQLTEPDEFTSSNFSLSGLDADELAKMSLLLNSDEET